MVFERHTLRNRLWEFEHRLGEVTAWMLWGR